MYAWACNLLPGVSGKSCNTQSRDLVLQLMERYEGRKSFAVYYACLYIHFSVRALKSQILVKLCLCCSRILSTPKARSILINGAVRKGERLIPPSAFEILMRVTFPASSARVKVGLLGHLLYLKLVVSWINCSIFSHICFSSRLLKGSRLCIQS